MNMDSVVNKINTLMTPKRMRYPYLVGAFLWIGWIISIIAGEGNTDLFGQLIGTDFAAFYTAGKIILLGKSPDLYNLDLAYSIQQIISTNQLVDFYPFLNPPQYALLMVPFALMPYPFAPVFWIVFNLLLLFISIRVLEVINSNRIFLLSLTWFPVFCAASFGQNSFLSLFLFSLTFFLVARKHNFISGIVYSLLLYKPQFLIAFVFIWLLDYKNHWKNLCGLFIGLIIQLGLIGIILPEAGLSYLDYFRSSVMKLSSLSEFPLWHAFSIEAFWSALLPNISWLSKTLYIISISIATFFTLIVFTRLRGKNLIIYSLVTIWLVLIIPYIMIYDWTILLFPAILLWKYHINFQPMLRVCFAILWIAALFSSALTQLQLIFLPVAIQIGFLSFVFVLVILIPTIYHKDEKEVPYKNSY